MLPESRLLDFAHLGAWLLAAVAWALLIAKFTGRI